MEKRNTSFKKRIFSLCFLLCLGLFSENRMDGIQAAGRFFLFKSVRGLFSIQLGWFRQRMTEGQKTPTFWTRARTHPASAKYISSPICHQEPTFGKLAMSYARPPSGTENRGHVCAHAHTYTLHTRRIFVKRKYVYTYVYVHTKRQKRQTERKNKYIVKYI